MSSLTAAVNPKLPRLLRDIKAYTLVVKAYLRAVGTTWDDVTPIRTGKRPEQRFRWYSDRLDKLLAEPSSPERDLAARIVHRRLWSLACMIEDDEV